jgi:hypothetical protein
MRTKSTAAAAALLLGTLTLSTGLAPAGAGRADGPKPGQQVCAGFEDGTPKIDVDGEDASVEVSAPEGFLIDAYCVKAGTLVEITEVDPPQQTVEIVATNGKGVSHYSVSYVADEGPSS